MANPEMMKKFIEAHGGKLVDEKPKEKPKYWMAKKKKKKGK